MAALFQSTRHVIVSYWPIQPTASKPKTGGFHVAYVNDAYSHLYKENYTHAHGGRSNDIPLPMLYVLSQQRMDGGIKAHPLPAKGKQHQLMARPHRKAMNDKKVMNSLYVEEEKTGEHLPPKDSSSARMPSRNVHRRQRVGIESPEVQFVRTNFTNPETKMVLTFFGNFCGSGFQNRRLILLLGGITHHVKIHPT